MANSFQVNVYQIDQSVVNTGGFASKRVGFPTVGIMYVDCSGSPTRSLGTGYNVYCLITGPDGHRYYVSETFAQIATAIG